MNLILGIICIILSLVIFKKGGHPSVRPYTVGLGICGIIIMVVSILILGGIIGLIGGIICLIGGYLALTQIHVEPLLIIDESLKNQLVCERCGGDISNEAKSCPHCGVRYE